MEFNQTREFAVERRLYELDALLHKRFSDAVAALQFCLSRYRLIFPEYTDHSNLHCMTILSSCNQLIGDQIGRMNADELYVLLTGAYFHDVGMGLCMKDYKAFFKQIRFGDYFQTHSRENVPEIIRTYHHEFSGLFIRKYAQLFEFPSEEHLQAVIQVARGHRKTDLTDENEYPVQMRMPGGNQLCLPYLAALVRLGDEIDVAADRNPFLLYDIGSLTDPKQILENRKLRAVRSLLITEKQIVLQADTHEEDLRREISGLRDKIQETLDTCRAAVCGRTPYVITQEQVLIEKA